MDSVSKCSRCGQPLDSNIFDHKADQIKICKKCQSSLFENISRDELVDLVTELGKEDKSLH